uniref:DUF569 domain-containing protein n=1 Tax=Hordeum vulgare subsp. vulgare TaxID=112509 RepID=A0A8I6Y2T4_HORVV
MDRFQDGEHVRLRSRVHGTYLHADEDGHGVSLHRRRASMHAAWSVHICHRDGPQLLFHSAAYGSYLAATDARAPPGNRGCRAVQRDYDRRELEAVRWHAVWADSGNYVVLRDVAGRCLRANKRRLGRSNGVSVDDIDDINKVSTMMHWSVEIIPAREGMPPLPRPIGLPYPGILDALMPSRMILYVREGADGSRVTRGSFVFRGRSVFGLRKKLVRRLRAIMDVSKLVVCVEAGTLGQLTPLVVDLPRSHQNLRIVVIEAGTPAHADLRCPDV